MEKLSSIGKCVRCGGNLTQMHKCSYLYSQEDYPECIFDRKEIEKIIEEMKKKEIDG